MASPFLFRLMYLLTFPGQCLGQNLAYLLVSHTVVSLVRGYNWELAPDKQPIKVPANWRGQPGRKGAEKCWPKSSLTLYAEVSTKYYL